MKLYFILTYCLIIHSFEFIMAHLVLDVIFCLSTDCIRVQPASVWQVFLEQTHDREMICLYLLILFTNPCVYIYTEEPLMDSARGHKINNWEGARIRPPVYCQSLLGMILSWWRQCSLLFCVQVQQTLTILY